MFLIKLFLAKFIPLKSPFILHFSQDEKMLFYSSDWCSHQGYVAKVEGALYFLVSCFLKNSWWLPSFWPGDAPHCWWAGMVSWTCLHLENVFPENLLALEHVLLHQQMWYSFLDTSIFKQPMKCASSSPRIPLMLSSVRQSCPLAYL